MGVVDRERHPWRFYLIRYQKNRCRRIGLVLFLSKRSELQQYTYSGKACFISYASKSKVDQRERRLNKTKRQLPAAIQATQDKIPGSVKLQMPLLWIGHKYIDLDLDSRYLDQDHL